LLRDILRLIQEKPNERIVEKPVDRIVDRVVDRIVEKPVVVEKEKIVEKEKTTLLYICIGVSILMTLSAISASVSSMRWESKYSKLVDRVLQIIHASNA